MFWVAPFPSGALNSPLASLPHPKGVIPYSPPLGVGALRTEGDSWIEPIT